MADQTFRCSECGDDKERVNFHEEKRDDRKRQVTSRCAECRSDAYFAAKYPDTICIQCLKHRPLDSNQICPRCNDASGKRQCRVCCVLKLKFFEFYGNRRICKDCRRTRRPSE
jgi:hypothetical protein